MRRTLLTPLASLENWLTGLAAKTGRSADTIHEEGLNAFDFGQNGVGLFSEDGSALILRNAFFLRHPHEPLKVAVFSEHHGYFAVLLNEDTTLETLPPSALRDVCSVATALP